MTSTQVSPSSSKISEEIQKLEPSAVVELFELKLTQEVNGIDQTYYYHAGTNEVKSDIVFNGVTYAAAPVEVKGFDKITKGTLPRPTFSIANANNAITNLMLVYNPLNAELKRIQTHKKFLDAVNFSSGTNATADPTAIAQTDDIWYIDRVATENPELVTFELTGKINMQNLRLPKRQIVEHCPWEYKGTQCGYNGSKCFNVKDEELFGDNKQTLDKCGHKYSSCLVRFKGEKIPFGGFLSARLQM
jgi:lambda family phage minor tail protein L